MDISQTMNTPEKDFFQHVFNFNNGHKSQLFNSIQYLLVAFVPILITNHLINKLFSEIGSGDDPRGEHNITSVQLLAEILAQLSLTISLLFIINNFVTYFSTYSGTEYTNLNMVNLVFMLLPMHKSSGGYIIANKINILLKRFNIAIFGDDTGQIRQNKSQDRPQNMYQNTQQRPSRVTISQPISNGHHMPSENTSYSQENNRMPPQESSTGTSNQIYGGPTTNLVNADFGIKNRENFDMMCSSDTTLISSLSAPSSEPPLNKVMSSLMPSLNSTPPAGEPCAASDFLGGSYGSSF